MIDVIKYDDGLPISVIVPLSKKRRWFFDKFVFPLLEANMPMEIIVNDNDGGAPLKRNQGFDKSTQPYVFFCDDDILLPSDLLAQLHVLLENNPEKGYAYTGYQGIVLHPDQHPIGRNFQIPSLPFNAENLKRGNYISTMSLVRRSMFPRFDESLKRLQDWDVWLTMLKNGYEGILLPDEKNMYFAYYLDQGITSNSNNENDALMTLMKKHGMI